MKKNRWILAIVLCMALVLSFAPAALAAEKTVLDEAALLEAVQNAAVGDVIRLGADIYLTQSVNIAQGQSLTIDLNGHAVTVYKDEAAQRSLYAINNSGTVTLTDSVGGGSITARGVQNLEGGTMLITGGKIVSCDTNGGACVWNVGDVTISGGTFETTHVGSPSDSYGVGCLNNQGTALVTGGTFHDVNRRTYAIISTGQLEITPASSDAVTVFGAHGALAVDSGTAVVNGGSYTSSDYYGLYASNDGLGQDPMQALVTVNGGTFSGPNYSVWVGSDYNNPVNSTVRINGGVYQKPLNAQDNTREGAIVVAGGEFVAPVEDEYLLSGSTTATLTPADGAAARYFVGTPDSIATLLTQAAQSGDALAITAGDVVLNALQDGVVVTNEGGGMVEVSNMPVKDAPVTSHTHVFDGDTCTVCGYTRPAQTQPDPVPGTGDTMWIVMGSLLTMLIAAACGAGIFVRRRGAQH